MNPLLLDLPAAIDTPRLHMRPPRAGDGRVVYEAIAESLAELRRYLGSLPWVAGEQSVDASEAWCRNSAANFMSRKDMPFLLFEVATGQFLGATGLHRMEWSVPKTEVGYWVRTTRAGEGFVTEAVRSIASYAINAFGARRLEIVTDAQNNASRRVAERCGFQLEGILRSERRSPAGELRDTCVYARVMSG